ncbi:type II toxin-antitoxin system HicA family toxin [bacterium]|nr:type II toxin-antitoxin system HicA family toxin [bacterium]
MTAAKLPALTASEVIGKLKRAGFTERKLGATSHVRMVHPDGRRTTVPMHKGKDIGRGLLRKILRDADIALSDFLNL